MQELHNAFKRVLITHHDCKSLGLILLKNEWKYLSRVRKIEDHLKDIARLDKYHRLIDLRSNSWTNYINLYNLIVIYYFISNG